MGQHTTSTPQASQLAPESAKRLLFKTIWPFLLLVVLLLAIAISGMHMMSAVRAYVLGESLWSKAEKQALIHLSAYAATQDPEEYGRYLESIVIPLADARARDALLEQPPDELAARAALVEGGNDPGDADDMIMLFRLFHDTALLREPLDIWARGEEQIVRLDALAERLHAAIQAGELDDRMRDQVIRDIREINLALTPLERAFSASLGESARTVSNIMTWALLILTGVLAIFGWVVSRRLIAQHMAANQAMHAEAQKNIALLRNTSDGMVMFNMKGDVVDVSETFCDMLGYTRDEMLGMNVKDWEANFSEADLGDMLALHIERGGRVEFETIHRRKDGSTYIAEVSAIPPEGASQPLFYCLTRDITDRKHMEMALQDSESRFRSQFESSPDATLIICERHFVEANQAAADLFGLGSREDVISIHPGRLSPPFQPDGSGSRDKADTMMALAEAQGVHRFEWVHQRIDDSQFICEVTLSRLKIAGEDALLTVIRDISERKAAEDRIREAAELQGTLRELLELSISDEPRDVVLDRFLARLFAVSWLSHMPRGLVFVHDPLAQTLQLEANHGVEPELAGRLATLDPDACLYRAAMMRDVQFGACDDADLRTTFPDMPRTYHYSLPLLSGAEVLGLLVIFLPAGTASTKRMEQFVRATADVLAGYIRRKQTEQSLVEYQETLETQVRERTEQLEQAKEAAEAANLAKSAFLANMSHEIRTPLNAIQGLAYLVRRAGLDKAQDVQMGKLMSANEHLGQVINAVLELSKIEAGKLSLEHAPLNPATVVTTVCALIEPKAAEKGLVVRSEIDPLPEGLIGDATRLQQALLNYASNAVKFTDAGEIVVRLRVAEQSEASVQLHFEVEDTGIGIAPDALPRLFSAFEQADNSLTRVYGGTGLGLAIARKLAVLMGGDAGASSEPGRGSRFWFSVRLACSDQVVQSADTRVKEDVEAALAREFAGVPVLLVDDEPFNREIGEAMLEAVGLAPTTAGDGIEAFEKAIAGRFAVVLMDMQMPRMDGLEATGRLRAHDATCDLPVIAMTANAFDEDRKRCLAAGMDDFIPKPIDPDVFYATLLTWLRYRARIGTGQSRVS